MTRDSALCRTPAFSPDGAWLFWSSDRSGVSQLYAMRTGTGTGRRYLVTSEPFGAYDPAPAADSVAAGYALDRAARALASVVDSALLDVGGQYLWLGPAARPTERPVGIPDPDNSLRVLGFVVLHGGSVRTTARARGQKARTSSVTVLAGDGLTAAVWSAAFLAWGCDSALAYAHELSVVCADAGGVRWTTDLQNRISLPLRAGRGP